MSKGISNSPQQTKASKGVWWYYENPGSIDVLIDAKKLGPQQIRIPASMLRRTMKRQQYVKAKSKKL